MVSLDRTDVKAISGFAGHTCYFVSFVMRHLNFNIINGSRGCTENLVNPDHMFLNDISGFSRIRFQISQETIYFSKLNIIEIT